VKIISWNINHRRNGEGQVTFLLSQRPDIVALQEVTAATAPLITSGLESRGLRYVRSTVFQIRIKSRFRGGQGTRWDAAERNVLAGLAQFGFRDAFRSIHGYTVNEGSWFATRGGREIKRRFDHIFVSSGLVIRSCQYLLECRSEGLSDHIPIAADVVWDSTLI
jgi:exonuclease III